MEGKRLPDSKYYSAALYMRLSRDDDGDNESSSITNQRKMLRAYAQENRYLVYDEYIDDGVSGTTFERPGFKRMIRDIEDKKVNMVITKDLSRLGRDYILAGQYTEIYFPAKKVRYIAINDGYDSESPYTDIAPFKNIINEMYARDISKKIRSSFLTHMKEGAYIGAYAPYGYQRDPEDKHHLIIDDVSGEIVREIFQKAGNGELPVQIARDLNRRKVLTPAQYRCLRNPDLNIENFSKRQEWTSSTIIKMLRNVVYVGDMAQGKTTKVSFKSDMTIANPKEDWYIVRNTHDPLVSRDLFELAARRSKLRTCCQKGKFHNIFTGMAKCADCGRNMSAVGTRKKGAVANLACGGYKLYGSKECSNHFIDYDTLCSIVLTSIQELVRVSQQDEKDILEKVQNRMKKQVSFTDKGKETASLKKRSRELDILIEKLYEDYVAEIINADRLKKMLRKYESESEEISERLEVLNNQDKSREQENPISKLKKLLNDIAEPTELTEDLLYRLVDHIEITQGKYEKKDNTKIKKQEVKIYFRFNHAPLSRTYTM
ncbi:MULTISPECIES: recombinase family protein [Blautia]|uniref:Recombinase family protein n=1 Tax=Blautia hominis TaxID=2025493 RepID=A0ABQ0BD40_9FIRM|nr:recombinase family protein [Blautia marasmi]